MAIGDIYQLSVNQALHGVELANVYNFEQLSDVTPGTEPENSLMEAWVEDISGLMVAMNASAWSITCLTCIKVRPTGGVRFTRATTLPGSIAGEANNANTACVGTLYSALAGPRGRGRNWYSGMPVNAASAGRLDQAALTAFNTFLDALIAIISWSADNADFIIRIISGIDAIIRPVDQRQARVRLRYLKSRRNRIC